MTYIAKKVLIKRLDSKAPHADVIRKVIDEAYAVGEAALRERDQLREARDPSFPEKLKTSIRTRYVPRMAEVARPLAALRSGIENERRANRGSLSPAMAALSTNLALADGALWTTRRDLAPMAGLRIAEFEIAEMGLC